MQIRRERTNIVTDTGQIVFLLKSVKGSKTVDRRRVE